MVSNISIGKRLRELRKAAGLTQSELAEHLHLRQSAVGKLERGENSLNIEHGVTLAELFNTTVEFIYTGVSPEAVDFNRLTGLDQCAIDALAEDPVFSLFVNRLARHRAIVNQIITDCAIVNQIITDCAKVVHDTEAMKNWGSENGNQEDVGK